MDIIISSHFIRAKEGFKRLISGYCLPIAAVLCLSGCGDFFAKKPTELEARAILKDIGQITENPNIGNPLPEMYRGPAKRINFNSGVKLFYFTKNHTVDILSTLVSEQLGKPLKKKISQSGPTNQMIIDCDNDEEADKVLEFLEMVDVPPIQVNIDCLILERFGDETMDWETSILIENFLGQKITFGQARNNSTTGVLSPAFPGASLRETERSTFGLDFGYWANRNATGHQVRAVVDMLISRGYLKILLNPILETVNGKKAMVQIRDNVPLEQTVTGPQIDPYEITKYQWVEDTLTVTPSVYSDGSVGIKTSITIGSKSKPEGVTQASVITERSIIIEENRIAPGQSLVIGGMRKSEKRSVIRGVPFFKDLPLVGVLFSSKDFEEKATEIIFILTPTISTNGMDYAKMIEYVEKKYESPKYDPGLANIVSDPFGSSAYTESVERKALEAESALLKAEKQIEQAEQEVIAARQEVEKAEAEKVAAQEAMLKAQTETQRLQAEKDSAVADAKKARALADKARAEADKALAETEKAKAKFEAAKAAAEKANLAAEKARQEAQQKTEPAPTGEF
jgi:Bacterial type II and III secretion system protein